MISKNNPYLDQLLRDCQTLIDNVDDWMKTDDPLLEDTITNIEEDINFTWKYED